jgi:hypothetical protein
MDIHSQLFSKQIKPHTQSMVKVLIAVLLSAIIVFTSCSASRGGYGCPSQEKDFWYKQAGTKRFSYDNIKK